jgi:hypothetical protein
MLKRIWQWIRGLFRRLFGGGTSSHSSSYPNRINSYSPRSMEGKTGVEAPPSLADSDYEYLFRQLLEGVAHSWDRQRILRWFEGLQGRVSEADWVAWLQRFGERVLASPAPNNELGMRLVLLGDQILGDQTQSIPSLEEIGNVAYDIGRQLLHRDVGATIWEYEGPDAFATASSLNNSSLDQEDELTNQGDAAVETITLDELLVRLQQDPNLLQMIAQQLGIETNDPQAIIQELINQFNATNQSANDEAEA